MMKDYTINNITRIIKSNSATVVLFGAGELGKLALYALKTLDIQVDCFCDSDERKQGKLHCGVKTISPKELAKLSPDAHIFICIDYITSVLSLLEQMNFINIYNCMVLFENTDFSTAALDMHPLEIQRLIAFHKNACLKTDNIASGILNLISIDIVVTERCSLKCRDCANLMQYYVKPKHCDLSLLFKSVYKFMECIDWLYELRVLGGEVFMNRQLHKIVNELVTYKNADNVVVYTNGTIIPEGENLLCLKNNKVTVDITNYGDISKKYDELIEVLKANNIRYFKRSIGEWTNTGIQYHQRTRSELTRMFMDCCTNDTITLLHGKLYRCPFSAHATNLNAIPFNDDDVVDFSDENSGIDGLKTKIKHFYNDKQYISACYYCNGRDYSCAKATPGVQIKDPLPLNV